jgi:hypothetical protein
MVRRGSETAPGKKHFNSAMTLILKKLEDVV